jgi:hypothetical protein
VITGSAVAATSRSLPTAAGKNREMGVVMKMVPPASTTMLRCMCVCVCVYVCVCVCVYVCMCVCGGGDGCGDENGAYGEHYDVALCVYVCVYVYVYVYVCACTFMCVHMYALRVHTNT